MLAQAEKKHKAQLDAEESKLSALKATQQHEIEQIFEDEKTLSFIKTMRNFKQEWQSNK